MRITDIVSQSSAAKKVSQSTSNLSVNSLLGDNASQGDSVNIQPTIISKTATILSARKNDLTKIAGSLIQGDLINTAVFNGLKESRANLQALREKIVALNDGGNKTQLTSEIKALLAKNETIVSEAKVDDKSVLDRKQITSFQVPASRKGGRATVVQLTDVTLKGLKLDKLDFDTKTNSEASLAKVDEAIASLERKLKDSKKLKEETINPRTDEIIAQFQKILSTENVLGSLGGASSSSSQASAKAAVSDPKRLQNQAYSLLL